MTARLAIGPRDRRALTLGALLLAPALCWRMVAQPYMRSRAELHARVEEQRGLLARELWLVSAAERMSADLSSARRHFATRQARLFPQREPLAAAGALATLVGDEARRRAVLVEGIESRPPEPAGGGLTGVRIQVRGRSDLEGVLEWLGSLEAGTRLLRLDALTLTRAQAPDSANSGPEVIHVEAVIRGFVRGPVTP